MENLFNKILTITQVLKLIPLVFLCCLLIFNSSCNRLNKNNSHQYVSDESIEKGKVFAATYCQSCHLLPEPNLLDAKSWENGVLPAMGPFLGIYSYGFQQYPSYKADPLLPADFYPARPVLGNTEWQNIIDYYTALSPDSLPAQPRSKTISTGLTEFQVQYPVYKYSSAGICLTKIDTSSTPHQLYLFDLALNTTFRYNNQLRLTDSVKSDATFTDIDFGSSEMTGCNINVINPNNGKFGNARSIHIKKNGKLEIDTASLFDSFARPVQITSCDLNSDQKTDYLVCEFGHLAGALSWMENTGANKFKRHVLKSQPGCLKVYAEDINGDGLQDVWALFSQGNEGISLFTNKGNNSFEERQVLRFPPSYGSTYFEFADFNKDGLPDIIYTCGDNADYSMILKPYHGVYIYLNQGSNQFKQAYFFPVNGCYKAMARDFDNDGDLDIVTIAFFADFASQPDEGFIYLKNKGNFEFEPLTIPEGKTGRWLTMDAADLDGDGKTDIILGNFSIRPSAIKPTVDWQKGPPFLVLKNGGEVKLGK